MTIIHPFDPIFDENTEILILGSFPSVKSRELNFYYMHPQNRFWKILEIIFNEKIIDKKAFLLKHHLGLWDVIKSCEIEGSSDSSIKNVSVNDIENIIIKSKIKIIICNGKKAFELFNMYCSVNVVVKQLPSTSSANAAYSLNKLVECYKATIFDKI